MQRLFVSAAATELVPDSHLPRGGWRRLVHASGNWWSAFSSAASLPGRSGVYTDSVGATDYAAGAGGDQHEYGNASPSGALRLPWSADHKYDHYRCAASSICDDWSPYADLGDCRAGVFLRGFHFAAVHEHEHAGLRGYERGGDQRRKLDCSTMQQMAISFGVATAGLATAFFIPRTGSAESGFDDRWPSQGAVFAGNIDDPLDDCLCSLKSEDGRAVSQQKTIHPGG